MNALKPDLSSIKDISKEGKKTVKQKKRDGRYNSKQHIFEKGSST